MDRPILYSFRRCPYAIRARWSILLCNQKVCIREVSLKNKPDELIKSSPKATVPILIKPNGELIEESLEIIYWSISFLDEYERSKITNDFKKGPITNLINENDNLFKYHLDRYKYPNRYKEVNPEDHRIKSKEILISWNNRIEASSKNNSQRWLLGNHETIADWSIWPFVRQYRLIDPIKFDNDRDLTHLRKWLEYYLNHQLAPVLMMKYKDWKYSNKLEYFPKET